MVLFLMFVYLSFPFLFSLLLSASLVLVCTAILLGTLLSFPSIQNSVYCFLPKYQPFLFHSCEVY
ncbi:hypothetical protein CsatA_000192 [Cannabis sativa]